MHFCPNLIVVHNIFLCYFIVYKMFSKILNWLWWIKLKTNIITGFTPDDFVYQRFFQASKNGFSIISLIGQCLIINNDAFPECGMNFSTTYQSQTNELAKNIECCCFIFNTGKIINIFVNWRGRRSFITRLVFNGQAYIFNNYLSTFLGQ